MLAAYFREYLDAKRILSFSRTEAMRGASYGEVIDIFAELMEYDEKEVQIEIAQFKEYMKINDDDFKELINGDFNTTLNIILKNKKTNLTDVSGVFLDRLISRIFKYVYVYFSKDLRPMPANKAKIYSFNELASVGIFGDYDFNICLSGTNEALLVIADGFVEGEFDAYTDTAANSVCEFLNCIAGIYVSELSHENLDFDLTVTERHKKGVITSDDEFNVIPFTINGKRADLIIAQNAANFLIKNEQ